MIPIACANTPFSKPITVRSREPLKSASSSDVRLHAYQKALGKVVVDMDGRGKADAERLSKDLVDIFKPVIDLLKEDFGPLGGCGGDKSAPCHCKTRNNVNEKKNKNAEEDVRDQGIDLFGDK